MARTGRTTGGKGQRVARAGRTTERRGQRVTNAARAGRTTKGSGQRLAGLSPIVQQPGDGSQLDNTIMEWDSMWTNGTC